MVKTLKEVIRNLVRETIREQMDWDDETLRVWGEKEAIKDLQDWMTVGNPHGTTKQEFLKYLHKDLAKKYGREAVMLAFDTIRKDKGCLQMKKLPDGREIVVWKKNVC